MRSSRVAPNRRLERACTLRADAALPAICSEGLLLNFSSEQVDGSVEMMAGPSRISALEIIRKGRPRLRDRRRLLTLRLELFSWLEPYGLSRRYVCHLAGSGVPANAALSRFDNKDSKATQFNTFPTL
jgi:hypothetical protein